MVLTFLIAATLQPGTLEAVARAAALEAAQNASFEVVSELDLRDLAEHEANRQLCGGDAESCAAQLAGAYDARLVLFLSAYDVGDESHVSLTLRDLAQATVLHRADASGSDDKELFADVRRKTAEALARFAIADSARTRLFVSRTMGVPATAVTAELERQPSPLALAGGAALALGAVAAVAGGGIMLVALPASLDDSLPQSDQQGARDLGQIGVFSAAAGLVIAAIGGGLFAVSP